MMRLLNKLVEVGEAKGVARRLFVTNSFDGLLTTIGVLLGSYIGGAVDPRAYIGAVLGGTVTMGIFSGYLGAFFSEKAERKKELKELQTQVMKDLSNTIYGKASKYIPYYVAAWSSVGLLLFPIISVSPFLLSIYNLITVKIALATSLSITNILVFMLGVYLGKVSGENVMKSGLTMLSTSLAATVLLSLVSIVI
jgi:predicted membrane protein (TIGR00267 family)